MPALSLARSEGGLDPSMGAGFKTAEDIRKDGLPGLDPG